MLDVGDQQAHGRRGARAHGDQDGGDVELRREAVGVHGAGAAEGHEDEVPRVVAPLHRDPPERADHGVVGDLHDPQRHLDHVQAERVGAPLLDGPPGRGLVEAHLAAKEVVRVEAVQDEVGVGDGGLGPALPVARGGGIGASALRADPQHAARVHPRDGAAARPDLDQIDDRGADGIAGALGAVLRPGRGADLVLLGDAGGAVLDEPGLGCGAAHVEGQDVVESQDLAEVGGDDDPRRGSRLDHEHGLGARGLEGEDAAARLHDQELPPQTRIPQAGLDIGEVPLDDGAHAGVDEGGAGPEVLAELGRHLRGEGDHRLREHLVHDLAGAALVFGIEVGMEIAHRERFHAFPPEHRRRVGDSLLVERRYHRSGRIQPLGNAEAEVPWRQRPRLLEQQVVEGGADLALDLQHVPEPLGSDEAARRELSFDDGVRGHGGAVHEVADIRRLDARLAQDALDRREEAHRGVARGGGDLRDAGLAGVLVDKDSVGEGSADVDSQTVAIRHVRACPGLVVVPVGFAARSSRHLNRILRQIFLGARASRPHG